MLNTNRMAILDSVYQMIYVPTYYSEILTIFWKKKKHSIRHCTSLLTSLILPLNKNRLWKRQICNLQNFFFIRTWYDTFPANSWPLPDHYLPRLNYVWKSAQSKVKHRNLYPCEKYSAFSPLSHAPRSKSFPSNEARPARDQWLRNYQCLV